MKGETMMKKIIDLGFVVLSMGMSARADVCTFNNQNDKIPVSFNAFRDVGYENKALCHVYGTFKDEGKTMNAKVRCDFQKISNETDVVYLTFDVIATVGKSTQASNGHYYINGKQDPSAIEHPIYYTAFADFHLGTWVYVSEDANTDGIRLDVTYKPSGPFDSQRIVENRLLPLTCE